MCLDIPCFYFAPPFSHIPKVFRPLILVNILRGKELFREMNQSIGTETLEHIF